MVILSTYLSRIALLLLLVFKAQERKKCFYTKGKEEKSLYLPYLSLSHNS